MTRPHRALAPLFATFVWLALSAAPASAQAPQPAGSAAATAPAGEPEQPISEKGKQILAINWQPGPISGSLGGVAEVAVPEGVIFADAAGTKRFLEINENPTNGRELGMVAAADFSWVATFEFSDIGYVKDDEKADLDADEILKSLREGNDEGNEERRRRGWGTVTIGGWATPPRYDPVTHNLEWATRVEDDGNHHITINHNIRMLGRDGVMETNLMASPEDYGAALPAAKKLLEGYTFKPGHKYSEWRQGEKVAAVGLTGLIVGGGIAAAAKTGLLAKMGKGVIKIIVAAGAAVAAGVAKLFGRKKAE